MIFMIIMFFMDKNLFAKHSTFLIDKYCEENPHNCFI